MIAPWGCQYTMRKFYCFIALLLYCSIVIYLLLPSPKIPPLPDSYKSTEPGDSGQIPNVVAAYYTNLSREEVTEFYQKSFSRSPFWDLPLITYKLNHPPEYSKEIIIDTIHSDFFEELVHPFKESLFINGWTPKEDKEYQRGFEKPIYEFERDGKSYEGKVILYFVPSNPLIRVIVFHLSLLAIFGLIYLFKSILSSKWFIR